MNDPMDSALDEEFASRLVACDEALAAGARPEPERGPTSPELEARLERGLACVRLLRQLHPPSHSRITDVTDSPSRSSQEAAANGCPGNIGRFAIRRLLGRGGFGMVYLAYDPVLNREVALKVPRVEVLADEVCRARFEREAKAAAALDHPNLVPVHEAGQVGPLCYIAMPYCPGSDLGVWLKQRGQAVGSLQAARLVLILAQAVHHAHARGVLHRDLKPGNVLLAPVPTEADDVTVAAAKLPNPASGVWRPDAATALLPRVTDFGLAKLASGYEAHTRTGAVLGTPSYMAPEQANGHAGTAGAAIDVYALGAILYEVLTGRPPFWAETAVETLLQVKTAEPVPPHRLRPHLPRDLVTICLKCLHKDPQRRYASALALAEDLGRFLEGKPILARPVGLVERIVKWGRRRPALSAALSAVVLVAALGSAGIVWQWRQTVAALAETEQAHDASKVALDRVKHANDQLVQAIEREQQVLSFQRIGRAARELTANNLGRAEELLAECPEHLRGWEWHFLKRLPYDPPRVVHASKTWLLALASSSDGRRFATASLGPLYLGELKLWDGESGQELGSLRGHFGPVSSLAFGPHDAEVASAGLDGTVGVWDVATLKLVRQLRGHDGPVLALAYSPDERYLASAGRDGTIRLWAADTGAERCCLAAHGSQVRCVTFSPDGQRLASWGLDCCVRIWDVSTGQERQRLVSTGGRVCTLHFHPDGRHLIAAGAEGLCLWDLDTGQEKWALKGVNGACLAAVFSPDGERLLCAGCDKTIKSVDWQTGQEVLTLRGHNDMVMAVAFTRNRKRLLSASLDGTVRLYNAMPRPAEATGAYRRFGGHTGHVTTLAFSPDQQQLASAGMDGTARLWDVATGALQQTLPCDDVVTCVAFQAEGKMLTTVTHGGSIIAWDASAGQRRQTLRSPVGSVLDAGLNVAFSADGERFAALDRAEGVRVWETASRRELARLPAAIPPYFTVFLSPDGKRLAAASFGHLQLLNVETRKRGPTLAGIAHIVANVAFSGDGQRLAAVGWDGTVRVWDVASGKSLYTFQHRERATCVAFHPSGRQLASGSCDNTARIWDLDTGRQVDTLPGHIGYVMAVAYSSDGSLLATASGHRYQGEVQVWKTASFGKNKLE